MQKQKTRGDRGMRPRASWLNWFAFRVALRVSRYQLLLQYIRSMKTTWGCAPEMIPPQYSLKSAFLVTQACLERKSYFDVTPGPTCGEGDLVHALGAVHDPCQQRDA